MKFKVREGFVVRLQNKIDLGNGRSEVQETTHFPGHGIDVDADVADQHLHKLDPQDKAAMVYLESKVLPVTAASALGVTPEMLALAKAMAGEMVLLMQAQTTAPAKSAG